MSKVYILRADGPMAEFAGSKTHISAEAFSSESAAKAKEASFRQACVTPSGEWDLAYLCDCDQVKIRILALTLRNGSGAIPGDAG